MRGDKTQKERDKGTWRKKEAGEDVKEAEWKKGDEEKTKRKKKTKT